VCTPLKKHSTGRKGTSTPASGRPPRPVAAKIPPTRLSFDTKAASTLASKAFVVVPKEGESYEIAVAPHTGNVTLKTWTVSDYRASFLYDDGRVGVHNFAKGSKSRLNFGVDGPFYDKKGSLVVKMRKFMAFGSHTFLLAKNGDIYKHHKEGVNTERLKFKNFPATVTSIQAGPGYLVLQSKTAPYLGVILNDDKDNDDDKPKVVLPLDLSVKKGETFRKQDKTYLE